MDTAILVIRWIAILPGAVLSAIFASSKKTATGLE